MSNAIKNVFRSAIGEVTETATEDVLQIVAENIGVPFAGLGVRLIKSALIGTTQAVMLNTYDDVFSRSLSEYEHKKLDEVFSVAEQQFWELAGLDSIDPVSIILNSESYQNALEVSEHLTLSAIRESQSGKVRTLGRFYGTQFYKQSMDWQDMHQILYMISELSFRQIVLIRLICEEFSSYDTDLFVSNEAACIEIFRLRDYGIWWSEGAALSVDSTRSIQLKTIHPTDYCKKLCKELSLDKIENSEISNVVKSLFLTRDGVALEVMTSIDVQELQNAVVWSEYGEEPDPDQMNDDEAQAEFDRIKGK